MAKKVTVKSTTLDNYVTTRGFSCLNLLIKIDVEGAEADVFAGAKQILSQFRPFIIVECFDVSNLSGLKGAGYLAYLLPENSNHLLIPKERECECRTWGILTDDTPLDLDRMAC